MNNQYAIMRFAKHKGPEFFKGKNEKAIRAYFQHALGFLMKKQRPDTFVSAVVHLDEKTPHMHVTFVPLTKDGRLSAKDIIGSRKHLIAWQDTYWQHMVGKFPELQRGESASKTGLKHIPPQMFKQAVRLTKQRQRIDGLLDGYIPDVEKIATQMKKYKVTFAEVEDLEAENAELTRELGAAKRGSITEKLEHFKLQQEYQQAVALLDRIPPEIKQHYASPTRQNNEPMK